MSKAARIPSYRLHKATGQARVTLAGKTHYFGAFGSQVSKQAYKRLIKEWLERPSCEATSTCEFFIDHLVLHYWKHCQQHYRLPSGQVSSELGLVRLALRPLRELYGSTAATAFGPLALKTVRQSMIDKKWCRKTINKHAPSETSA